MATIRVLDDHLINRIAAGEVVERPASVLKELLENSLDAGATAIEVVLEAGGKRRIRVVDDGVGMSRDDALLALERHATSKLSRAEDLDAIATLGFRGEALPSIAAVSRFVLQSATEPGAGTEIEVRAGRIAGVRDVGAPRGTTIDVLRLFHNVPARRKFLRADNTELSHCVRLVTRIALARPDVRFRVEHGGRTVLDASRSTDVADRVREVLGRRTAEHMVPFRLERDGVVAHGLAGRPVDASPRRQGQHVFVNGRVVQDRVLRHALTEAYGNTVPRGHAPPIVLFVEVDPNEVDVNVHPQKAEVRFRHGPAVHDAVRDAVRRAFSERGAVPDLDDLRPVPWAAREVREPARYDPPPPSSTPRMWDPPSEPTARVVGDAPTADGARALLQFRDSYIVAEDGDGLVVIDQHAAHERVLFERFLAAAENETVEIQRLVIPATMELARHERIVLDDEIDELRRLGFLVEPFGGDTIRIDGVPAVAGHVDPGALLRELLGEAARVRSARAGAEGLRHRWITTASCKAAITIHRPLRLPEMQRLLDDLAGVENPTTCPHGRPVQFRLTLDEIERAFRRK